MPPETVDRRARAATRPRTCVMANPRDGVCAPTAVLDPEAVAIERYARAYARAYAEAYASAAPQGAPARDEWGYPRDEWSYPREEWSYRREPAACAARDGAWPQRRPGAPCAGPPVLLAPSARIERACPPGACARPVTRLLTPRAR